MAATFLAQACPASVSKGIYILLSQANYDLERLGEGSIPQPKAGRPQPGAQYRCEPSKNLLFLDIHLRATLQ